MSKRNTKGKTKKEKKKRPPETITLLNATLPKCLGKIIEEYPLYAPCPVHANAPGTMTTWLPQKGLDPNMREFSCPYQHAFYTRVHDVIETKPKKKRVKSLARSSW